jgi:xanthine dehydrogenase accessory factor
MDSQDRQVLGAACRWHADGQRFALVTVARTWGSAPRPPGAMLALRGDGALQGSVSGGCIEDDLIARMRAGEFAEAGVQVVRYGGTVDEARRFGLPCGGTLELVVEAAPDARAIAEILERIGRGELVSRRVNTESGDVVLGAGRAGVAVDWDGRVLVTPHGPRWRLLLIGAGQVARFLAPMAQALDYLVFVCDPRAEYSGEWDVAAAPLLPGMPDDVVRDFAVDPHTAIVALTHDPRLDDLALLEALKSPAFYVGALGSRVNNERRRLRLLEHFDLGADEIARLHGPVGLPIGSRTPPEIAVSILAELTAVKNAVRPVSVGAAAETDAYACRQP